MTDRYTSSILRSLTVLLLAASAGAWAVHPFIHSPLAQWVACCEAAEHGPVIPDPTSDTAGQHSPHCQLCRLGEQAVSLTVTVESPPALPVFERIRWAVFSEPLISNPFSPGLPPRAPPALV